MARQQIGSFAPYLEAKQKRERRQKPASKVSAVVLLPILAAAEGRELPVSELMSRSGMAFSEFSAAYLSLETAGLIELRGSVGEESIRLTPSGREIATVAGAD